MTIQYKGDAPTENGVYLVRSNGELTVAEQCCGNWEQLGIDYDVWQFSCVDYEIEVIKKLDLEALANA